jgi:hypothetical protein
MVARGRKLIGSTSGSDPTGRIAPARSTAVLTRGSIASIISAKRVPMLWPIYASLFNRQQGRKPHGAVDAKKKGSIVHEKFSFLLINRKGRGNPLMDFSFSGEDLITTSWRQEYGQRWHPSSPDCSTLVGCRVSHAEVVPRGILRDRSCLVA